MCFLCREISRFLVISNYNLTYAHTRSLSMVPADPAYCRRDRCHEEEANVSQVHVSRRRLGSAIGHEL